MNESLSNQDVLGFENDSANFISIEQLLLQAELISQEELETSLQLSAKMRTSLESILCMQNYINSDLFARAGEIQRLIQTRAVSVSTGITALWSIKFENASLEEALNKHKDLLPEVQPLGATLRSIGAITDRQLRAAEHTSSLCLLPIGWILSARGIISQSLYASALTAQFMLQRNLLAKEQIFYYSKLARLQQKDLRELLNENDIDTEGIDRELAISQLLIISGVLVKTEVLAYREFALLEDTELETILLNFNILSEAAVSAINDSFIAISNNDLTVEQAIIALHKLNQVDWDFSKLEEESDNDEESVPLTDLIDSAHLLTPKQLSLLMEESLKNRLPVYDVLIKHQFLEQPLLEALEKSKQLIDLGLLTFQQGVLLLLYCAEFKCDLLTAFAQFGWNSWQFDT